MTQDDPEDLEAVKADLELLLSATGMSLWVWDLKTGIVRRSKNHARIYGFFNGPPPDWAPERNSSRYVHPEDWKWLEEKARQVVAGEFETSSLEYRIIWPDGSVRWITQRIRVYRDAENKPSIIRGAIVDITQLKSAETQLKEALAVRDKFLSIASHELRTPLSSLSLMLDLLSRKFGSADERIEQMLKLCRRQAANLGRLVGDLLDVTHLSRGEIPLRPQDTSLESLLDAAATPFLAETQASRRELSVRSSPGITGRWDPHRLEQVVVNLISNALKYGGDGPVEVSASRVGETAEIRVRDYGIGIAPCDHDRIFGRFERAVSGSQYSGLGLGLHICREIVRSHGGDIRVESALGQGSTFIVSLPLRGPAGHGP